MSEMIDDGPYLMPEEEELLRRIPSGERRRCKACGHLNVLHNEHCCTYCLIPECPCEWGRMDGSTKVKK